MPGWCPKLVPNELQSDGVCPAFLAKKLDGLLHSRAAQIFFVKGYKLYRNILGQIESALQFGVSSGFRAHFTTTMHYQSFFSHSYQ